MINKKWYGWIPDLPDKRDYMYSAIRPAVRLPQEADLRGKCSNVENQGALGSCTANALAGNLEFLDNMSDADYTDVSRLFIYYNERLVEGTVDSDSGASLRDGIKTLKKFGACWEYEWPYIIKKFDKKPSDICYKKAAAHRIKTYHRIMNLSEMLACLCDGYPFVFGFTVYESFESSKVAKSGIVNMPKADERAVGGHAVMAVGFTQKGKRFLVRNSWGADWGMDGYFTMPYKYLETLAGDFWTIRG